MNQVREGDVPQDHRRHAHHGGGANGEPVGAIDHAAHGMMSICLRAGLNSLPCSSLAASNRRRVSYLKERFASAKRAGREQLDGAAAAPARMS
jgi:hypothetical protein